MLGVPIIGMSLLYENHMTVITTKLIPGSYIKMTQRTCSNHFIGKASAAGIVNFIDKKSKNTELMHERRHYHHIYSTIT